MPFLFCVLFIRTSTLSIYLLFSFHSMTLLIKPIFIFDFALLLPNYPSALVSLSTSFLSAPSSAVVRSISFQGFLSVFALINTAFIFSYHFLSLIVLSEFHP